MKKTIGLRIFATLSRGEGEDTEKDIVKIEGDGTLSEEDGRVLLCYDEMTEENGKALCTLSFEKADPSVVTLVREGAVSSVMTFSERARYGGKFDLGFAEMEFTVATRRVVNRIDPERGGTLLLDYSTEVQGVPLQAAKYRFEIF